MIIKTKVYLLFISFILLSTGCATIFSDSDIGSSKSNVIADKRLHHLVFCWLKDPGNQSHRDEIIGATKIFREIPGVIDVQVGHVLPSERDIVDDSFDVGILVVTKDAAGLQNYLDHPIHQQVKKEVLVPLVEKIIVYDFVK